jgi:hypothetical protein
MSLDIMNMNRASPEYAKQMSQSKKKEATENFMGYVLSTVLEPMIPKEGPFEDANAQLFFGMWFEELMKDPEMIKSMGMGDEIA